MSGLEDTLNNKNEQNEKLPQNPEVQETVESIEDMQKRLSQEMTAQHEQLKDEDKKIETANVSIGLSVEEVQEEKNSMNLDAEISTINAEAEKLTNESKRDLIENKEKSNIDGVDFVFAEHPELEKIGTKEQYKQYIENIFPESKVKDILYHYSSYDKIKEEGFKYFTETGVATGAGAMEGIWLTKKSTNYWGSHDLNKYAAVINAPHPLDGREESSDESEVVKEYKLIYERGTEKELDNDWDPIKKEWDQTKKFQLQKNRKAAFQEAGYDSILGPDLEEVAVLDKENIHILGSKSDMEKFNNFVKSGEKL